MFEKVSVENEAWRQIVYIIKTGYACNMLNRTLSRLSMVILRLEYLSISSRE